MPRKYKLYTRITWSPELQAVYSALPLVLNVPERLAGALGDGVDAGRQGLPEEACPYNNPELRAMWFDGHAVGRLRSGPVEVRVLTGLP